MAELSQKAWIRAKLQEVNHYTDLYPLYEQFKKETNTNPSYESYKRVVRKATQSTTHRARSIELQATKDEVKRLRATVKELTKSLALEEKLMTGIYSMARAYKPYPKEINLRPQPAQKREAVLMLSDWHLDEKVDEDEVFNINVFNWEVAEQRIDAVFTKAFQNACELNCETLNLMLLGDFFSGIIKEDLIYGSEIGLTPTIIRAFDIMARYIQYAARHFNIRVACAFGNHTRVTPMKGFNKAYSLNLEWMMYEFLKKETHAIVQDFVNPKSPIYIIEIQGYNFMIMHGDMISGGNNLAKIPAITFSRDAAKINGALATKHYTDLRNKQESPIPTRVDYILAAHFHNEFTIPGFDDVPILGNGCLIGGNSFSLKEIKAMSRPSQRFFIVENGAGIRFMDTIYLDYLTT